MNDIATDGAKIQRILRSYFKSLYSTKLENVNKIEESLHRLQLPKLNQDQVNNINSSVSPTEIKAVIKIFSSTKGPGPDGFSAESTSFQKLVNTNNHQTISQSRNPRNTAKLIL